MRVEDLKSERLKEFYNSLRIGSTTIEADAYNALANSNHEDQLVVKLLTGLDKLEGRIKEAVEMIVTGAREIGVTVERSPKAIAQSIRVYRVIDEHPDLSYLETTAASHFGKDGDNWLHVPTEERKRVIKEYGTVWDACIAYAIQDKKRLTAYNNGEWHMLGISAKATVLIPMGTEPERFKIQEVSSGGLWGIESDSEESYLKLVEAEQVAELRNYLRVLNVSNADTVGVDPA